MARLTSVLSVLLACSLIFACSEKVEDENNPSALNPNFLLAQGEVADPNYVINLPQDHLSHPTFDIEWWYLTANLKDEFDQEYAFQWTLFRFANKAQQNSWHQGQSFMAHTSLHSVNAHWFEEKFASGGLGNAGIGLHPSPNTDNTDNSQNTYLAMHIDEWRWQGLKGDGSLFPAKLTSSVNQYLPRGHSDRVNIELTLTPSGPFVLHGNNGYSVKSEKGKHASHYYSLPFIDVTGTLISEDGQKALSGKAWYDHEWTSTLLDSSTAGWDWMSLHLDNGDKIMAFSMRLNDQENYQTGTYIDSNGNATTLMPEQISLDIARYTEVNGKSLPLHWQLAIEQKGINVGVVADKKDAYNQARFPYYEGSVSVSGTHSGKGFLELTGY